MRFIAIVVLILVPILTLADELTCYSNGRMIYSGKGNSILYEDGLFGFVEKKSGHVVMVSGDCVVKASS